ncbi:xanthine dehydrogenase [Aureococcus anophagefferens]|nr:xanthine dehydrogenase [Aureococcus anophagefferens]
MYLYLLALVVLSWVLLRLRRRAEPVEARSEDPVKSPPAEDPPSTVVLTINGAVHRVENPSPSLTLLAYLRDRCGLTAAKVGCGEGGCGACTVVEHNTDAINACLRLLCQCDGSVITTAEGLGSSRNGFGDIQKAIADGNRSQSATARPAGRPPVALRARPAALEGLPDVEDAAPCRGVTTGRACGRACGAPPSRGLSVADDARRLSYVEPTSLPRLYALWARASATARPSSLSGATAAIGVAKYYDDCLGAPGPGPAPLEDAQLVATKSVPELTKLAAARRRPRGGGAVISALSAALRGGLDVAWNAAAAHLDRVANTQRYRGPRDDMAMTGGREATACDYEVSFDAATGALASYAATFAVEGGPRGAGRRRRPLHGRAVERQLLRQRPPRRQGKVLKTRAPRSSSMRSPGVIQSQCCRELAIVRVAHEARPVHEVQELNF